MGCGSSTLLKQSTIKRSCLPPFKNGKASTKSVKKLRKPKSHLQKNRPYRVKFATFKNPNNSKNHTKNHTKNHSKNFSKNFSSKNFSSKNFSKNSTLPTSNSQETSQPPSIPKALALRAKYQSRVRKRLAERLALQEWSGGDLELLNDSEIELDVSLEQFEARRRRESKRRKNELCLRRRGITIDLLDDGESEASESDSEDGEWLGEVVRRGMKFELDGRW